MPSLSLSQGTRSAALRAISAERLASPERLTSRQRSLSSCTVAGGLGEAAATGPKLFVAPKTKSNRSVIANALTHCCLAGDVNQALLQVRCYLHLQFYSNI